MSRVYAPKTANGYQVLPAARGQVHEHYDSKNIGLREKDEGTGAWCVVSC